MNILVLGGGGFIGSHLIGGLLTQSEHRIFGYDLFEEKLVDHMHHPRLTFIQGDLREDHSRVEDLIKNSNLVIDLIAHANPSLYVTMPLDVVKLNFNENLLIAECCVKHNKRLIQFSTCEVYGKTVVPVVEDKLKDPTDPQHATFCEDETHFILGPVNKHRWIYSCAKQLLERLLHAYGLGNQLNYTIIRPFNFIGPRIDYLPSDMDGNPRVFSHFLRALKDGSDMKLVNGGKQQRCYSYIDDAISCMMHIVENPDGVCDQQIFNIGSPANELTIRELAEKMLAIYKRRWWDGKQPLSKMIEVSGDEFYGAGYDDSDRRIPDITKATKLLNWQPKYNIEQTLERSMEYWFEDSAIPSKT